MLIEAGFDVAFECPAVTPMILQLSIHPSRDADLLTPDRIVSDPSLPMRSYLDLFGNRVTRVEVPSGLVTFSDRFIIRDSSRLSRRPAFWGKGPAAAHGSRISMVTALSPMSMCADRPTKVR
jgi:hypothetical protein